MNRQVLTITLLSATLCFGQMSDELPAHDAKTAQSMSRPFGAKAVTLAQDNAGTSAEAPYKMRVSINEVSLIFHAADRSGQPVDDLKASDVDLFDNEAGPGAILALQLLKRRPLRVAFLIDSSGSVSGGIGRNRMLAVAAAQALLRNKGGNGVAIGFRRTREVVQPWSADLNAVEAGIRRIGSKPDALLDGTSLFDTLWSTCFYEFRGQQEEAQNVVLLFTDGVDTSSHATLTQAVGACQQAHASVFVFTSPSDLADLSVGNRTLRTLSEQTGGSLIQYEGPEVGVVRSVDALAAQIRSEYQLFYRPKNLKRDGSFHRVVLVGPPRVAAIVGQSGYYASPQ